MQDGRHVSPGLESMYRPMPVLKPQNDEGTAEMNWLLLKYNVCSFVSSPTCEGMDELRLLVLRLK